MNEPGRQKKPLYLFWTVLLLLAAYVGYSAGKADVSQITIETMGAIFLEELKHPLPVEITPHTGRCLLLALAAWALGFLTYVSKIRNEMPGREFGTARFAPPKQLNRRIADKDDRKNKILSESLRMSMDTRKTRRNNNMLVIGGSGAGKSMFLVTPNLLQCLTSYIFTDPKGELLRENGSYLKAHGYCVKVLNLVEMEQSDGYNPFDYIRSETDVIKLITNLIANTTPKNATKGDPFWEKSESMYLQALFLYVWLEYPKLGKTANFRGVLELMNQAEISEDESAESGLDRLMNHLEERHPARVAYQKVRRGAVDTVRSIFISASSRLAYLENPEVLRLLDRDEMQLPFLGTGIRNDPEKKTALFCVVPDSDKSYNFIVGLLYTQLFQELYYQADFHYGGRLPVPVTLWMDEFVNIALPDDFCSLLSTMRSREISCNIIIQNLAQIKAMFKDTWETIPGNCDVMVYLGGNEKSTHQYISEALGKWTIDKTSTGETRGRNGSSSRNFDVIGRELLQPNEVRKLPNDTCLVFVRGLDPVYDKKYRTFETETYKEARGYGPYQHRNGAGLEEGKERLKVNGMEEMERLSSAEVDYYKELARKGAPVSVVELTEEELMHLDLSQFQDRPVTEEEIRELLSEEECQTILAKSAAEDEVLQAECDRLKESIGRLQPSLGKRKEAGNGKQESLAMRLASGEYTPEQIEEAKLGMKAGLPEAMILMYFLPGYEPEHMRELRKLAEQLEE